MKRDMDLIRLILLKLEGKENVNSDLAEYTKNQVNYHKALLLEAGLAEGSKPKYSMSGGQLFQNFITDYRRASFPEFR